ncbi:MAG: M3 family metallopeptidase, partial [Pseudomonadota bacterium]
SRRMALTPEKALSFLEDLKKKLSPIGMKERRTLLEVKKEVLKDETPLASYEWRFLHNQLLKRRYDFDPLQVQEYFPLDTVLKGMFEIFQTVLGVSFKKDAGAQVWHPSVQKFEVWKEGALVSHFYMDLFPREGKYNHAAAFTLISAYRQADGAYQIPFSSIVANFSGPTTDKPSLLQHSEVETLFHEFGHIMHQILTTASYPSFSGTGVKTDFVEAPSQMFENWVWDKEMLQKLSGHYQRPSEKLPSSLIEKMLAAKNLNQGLHNLRQLSFGFIDFDFHTHKKVDSTEVYSKRMNEILGIPILPNTLPQASFGHLMGGYDAGYYGYLWAEVFAQDMFTRFEKEGLLNPKTGEDYRKWILEPGGEKPPNDLIRGFLGREPSSDAFLKGLGL